MDAPEVLIRPLKMRVDRKRDVFPHRFRMQNRFNQVTLSRWSLHSVYVLDHDSV